MPDIPALPEDQNRLNTIRATVDAAMPEAPLIEQAAAILQRGGLVAFPTETVYGLGANGLDPEAVARIFAAKGRPANNPLIVHVPDIESAKAIVAEWPDTAAKLADHFWPGPLTLILPRTETVPDIVTAGGPTVAVRMPAHPVALALLLAARLPLAAPSANRSTHTSPTRAEHVLASLDGRIDMVLDGGPTSGGLESTVLDLTTSPPRLLRPGLISPAEIIAIIGPITLPPVEPPPGPLLRKEGEPPFFAAILQENARRNSSPSSQETENKEASEDNKRIRPPYEGGGQGVVLPSPGMMERHYAPRAPLELLANSEARVQELLHQGEHVGWLTISEVVEPTDDLLCILMPHNAKAYAARLYAVLHALDAANVTRIVVETPPTDDDWLAIHDRLRRASTPAKEA